MWGYLHLQGQLVTLCICALGEGVCVCVLGGGTAQESISLTIQFEGLESSNKHLLSPAACREGGECSEKGQSRGVWRGILRGAGPHHQGMGSSTPWCLSPGSRIWWR